MRITAKKGLLLLLLFVCFTGLAFAQTWYNSYAPGIVNKTFLNVGVGLGNNRGFTMGVPPLQVSLDFKLSTGLPITLGATGMFSTWNYFGSSYINTGIGGRSMYHFNFARNLDAYTGLTLGWVISLYEGANYSFLLYGGLIGAGISSQTLSACILNLATARWRLEPWV